MYDMKNWLLYFFALFLASLLLPLGASVTVAARKTPSVTVYDGEKEIEMSVEDYTLRVLLESGAELPPETKKALAVSIRSVAVYASTYGIKHNDYSFCTDNECCFSLGDPDNSGERLGECKTAVEETYSLVLTDGRNIALSLFTRCAGSGTRRNGEIPYLSPVSEPEECNIHIEEKRFPVSVLGYNAGEDSCVVYSENKKCAFAVFGGRALSADELTSILNLASPEITVTYDENDIVVVTRGSGHCYGLNLCGAIRMENKNYDFKEILKNYFPELELKKIYR